MNVYFNSCFTQTAEAIKFLKLSKNNIKIFITNKYENIYLKNISDFYEIEKEYTSDEEYTEFCLNFCKTHKIDVFYVRYKATELSKYKYRFDEIGVKTTFVTDFNTYKLLDNKVNTYKALESDNIIKIPPYGIATNFEEYKELYKTIKESGFTVCIKPVDGIGGVGFKQIKDDITAYDELMHGNFTSISKERADFVLKTQNVFKPLMVLGYLEGDEYSIDCLAKNGELIDAIPRIKINGYTQLIEPRKDIIDVARKLTNKFGLNNIFNIQVKYHKNQLYLIEINTRMSGGIFKSCMSGINIMSKSLNLLLGKNVISEIDNLRELKVNQRNDCYIEY